VQAELERIARAVWPLVAGVLLGLAIGGVWTLLQPDRYRAESDVILRGSSAGSLAPAVETLANGSVVEQNVKQTLRLAHLPELSARVHQSVVTMSAVAGSRERARQVDAEAVQVLTQLVAVRFGSQGLQATLLDPAHVVGRTSPTTGGNLLICGLLGLVVGGGLAYPRRRHSAAQPTEGGAVDPNVERRLKKRIDEVTKRERAMARRAGELAGRKAELEARKAELEARKAELEARKAELDRQEAALAKAKAEPVAAPKAEPEPPPRAEVEPTPIYEDETPAGRWNLRSLEALVRDAGDVEASQREQWTSYLYFLREHAESDGTLPRSFDSLVSDVFADLVGRRGDSA
jgi:hypothetical protein